MRRLSCIPLAVGALVSACAGGGEAHANGQAAGAEPAGYVDTIVPMAEALRRFREGLPIPAELEAGAASRDELVESFLRAIQAKDTLSIRRMLISQGEYAYLYFPTSVYMTKPYELAPALAWFLNVQNSEKGITRVMRRLGGDDLEFKEYSCADEAREVENTFWRSCTVVYRDPQEQSQVTRRIFGSIIERDGRFKFLSYANDF